MTVSRRTLAAAALLASGTAILARNPALAEGPDVAAVEAAVSSLTKAMLAADRAKLEALVDDLISRTVGPCKAALEDAGLKADQLDEVVLVGGSTRIPKVQQIVR